MDFVAIDFETANEKRWSPCEVSAVKVENGAITEAFTRLIKPHKSVDFKPWNINLHGIRPSDVASSSEFDETIHELLRFASGLPLVAHSAGFDMGVLCQTARLYEIKLPQIRFYCSRVLAKRTEKISVANYRLSNVCDALDITFKETHRAEADATAAAEIVLSLAKLESAETLDALASVLLITPGVISGTMLLGTRSARVGQHQSALGKGEAVEFLASLAEDDLVLDEDFAGKEVIFTGTLASMERKDAQEKVLRAGGLTGNNVTRKTSIVVVGAPYDSQLEPGCEVSGKLKKVIELQNAGMQIDLITEREFLELFEN